MSDINYTTLAKCLLQVPDPRSRRGRRYEWQFLLLVATSAVMAGQKNVRAMAQWLMNNREVLLAALQPRRKIVPSAATLYRMLQGVSTEMLEKCVSMYTQAIDIEAGEGGRIVTQNGETLKGQALDGKTVCGASAHGESVHLVSVVRHESGTVLAQEKVATKRDEREAAQRLLSSLPLKGTITTFDALHTQVKEAKQILEGGGEYLMEVKRNQPALYEDISLAFQAMPSLSADETDFWSFETYDTVNKQHGRLEYCRLESTTALNDYLAWPGVAQVLRRISTRKDLTTGKFTNEVHYGVTSLRRDQVSLPQLEQLWRWHWTVENRTHYPRDVSMGEDACQVHTGSAPQAFAALRNAVLSLLHHEGWPYLPDAFRFFADHVQKSLQLLGALAT